MKDACDAISDPRSHICVRFSCFGGLRTRRSSAFTTVWLSFEFNFTGIEWRGFQFTSVTMYVLPEPTSRSPSQCPGRARSSASARRSRIDTASLMPPRP